MIKVIPHEAIHPKGYGRFKGWCVILHVFNWFFPHGLWIGFCKEDFWIAFVRVTGRETAVGGART